MIGLSVHTAPVEIREKLAIPEAEWPHAIDELCSSPHIEEAGVLSTCNRMEIYVVALSWHRGIVEVEHWLSKVSYSGCGQILHSCCLALCLFSVLALRLDYGATTGRASSGQESDSFRTGKP